MFSYFVLHLNSGSPTHMPPKNHPIRQRKRKRIETRVRFSRSRGLQTSSRLVWQSVAAKLRCLSRASRAFARPCTTNSTPCALGFCFVFSLSTNTLAHTDTELSRTLAHIFAYQPRTSAQQLVAHNLCKFRSI